MVSAFNMVQPVSLNVRYSVDDALQIAKYAQNQSFVNRNDALLTSGLVFIGFAIFIVFIADDLGVIYLFGTLIFSAIMAGIAGGLVFLYRKIVMPRLAKQRVLKYFRSSPLANDKMQIEFSTEGISTIGHLGSSLMKWDAITKALESDNHLMFYTGDHPYPWYVPKNSFGGNDDFDNVKILIHAMLTDRAVLH